MSPYYPFLSQFVERHKDLSHAYRRLLDLREAGFTVTLRWDPERKVWRLTYEKGENDGD
jgi:hypothetical protein